MQPIAPEIDHLGPANRESALVAGSSAILAPFFADVQVSVPDQLCALPDEVFDFILLEHGYRDSISGAGCIFQAQRLLKAGGILRAGFERGTRDLSRNDLNDLARSRDFQILSNPNSGLGQMWITWRKQTPDWRLGLPALAQSSTARIRRLTNAFGPEPAVPNRGRYAALSIWVEGLAPQADLLDLEVLVADSRAGASAVSAPLPGSVLQRIEARLTGFDQTGMVPVKLIWFGHQLGEPATLRVIPPGPAVPHVVGVAGSASRLNGVTVTLEELTRADDFSATLGGRPVWGIESVCADLETQRYDIHFQLPDDIAAGAHMVQMSVGERKLPPLNVELA